MPKKLDEVVARALERDPDRRFGSARELAFEIEAAIEMAGPPTVAAWVESGCPKRMAKLARLFDSTRQHMAGARQAVLLPAPPAVQQSTAAQALSEAVEDPVETVNVRALDSPKGRRGKSIAIAAAILALVVGILLRSLFLGAWHGPRIAKAPSNQSPASVGPPASARPAPAAPEVVPLAQTSPSGPAVVESDIQRAVATDAPVLGTRTHAAGHHRPPSTKNHARHSMARNKGTAAPNCDPPTYIDSEGIRIFKDECL